MAGGRDVRSGESRGISVSGTYPCSGDGYRRGIRIHPGVHGDAGPAVRTNPTETAVNRTLAEQRPAVIRTAIRCPREFCERRSK